MKRFKVVACSCGTVQSTEAEKTIKCVRCGKSKQMNKVKILKTFDTGKQAVLFVQEYNKLKWKQSK